MQLTAFDYFVNILQILAYATLGVVILYRRSYQRWPFLFSLSILQTSVGIALLLLTGDRLYPAYFYTYWVDDLVKGFLVLGVLFDIVRVVPGVRFAPSILVLVFLGIALSVATGSVWMAFSGGAATFPITMMALSMDRCIVVVWGAFAITLFMGMGACGLGWTDTPLRLAATFLVLTFLSGADAYAMSTWPTFASKIDVCFNIFSAGVWLSWSGIILHEKQRSPTAQSEGALRLTKTILAKTHHTAY